MILIKKILLFSLLIIFIPVLIIGIFIRDDEITFKFSSNSVIRVLRGDTNKIESVPIENYVTGVLAGEMPVDFNIEALKAQAVAARSYVMKQVEKNKNKEYDVVDTVINQVYLDDAYLQKVWNEEYNDKINKIKTAILETKGEYLSYKGKVAETLFFSTSSGYTENSEDIFPNKVEYLRSVESKWDKISKYYSYTVSFTLEEFYTLLGLDYNKNLKIEIIEKTSTGRPKLVKINGIQMSSKEVCSKLKLKSTYFEIISEGNKIIVKTKGFGHGVGMSQYGAEGMAREGYTYKEILNHYYKGTEIKKFN